MAPTRQVEFSTFDGTILRGNLYLPDKDNAAVVIFAVGLTFLKEHFGDIPDRLRDLGYAVFVFDPRNWGSSDGQPRQHIDLNQQSNDMSDAISFMCSQSPAINAKRVGLFGGGHGGGVIMPVAATDPRVKVAMAVMPFFSGLDDSRAWPNGHAEKLWRERQDRAASSGTAQEPVYVQIFPDSLEAAQKNPTSTVIGLPQIIPFYQGVKSLSDAVGTPWENKVTLQTLFHQRRWTPTAFLPQLKIPFLYVTAKNDEFNPHEKHLKNYETISGPKEMLILESENLSAFMTEETRNKMLEKLAQFLKDNL